MLRYGNEIQANIPLFSDQAPHYGFSAADTGRVALFRDGQLVGETADPGFVVFNAPSADAAYRLEVSADRGDISPYSIRVSAAYTFRSARAGDDSRPVKLPVMAVRYWPVLDDAGRVRCSASR